MAELSTLEKIQLTKGLMRHWSVELDDLEVVKAAIFDAVSAMDTWINDEQANAVGVLPEPFKSKSSVSQKALLFMSVASMRTDKSYLEKLLSVSLD